MIKLKTIIFSIIFLINLSGFGQRIIELNNIKKCVSVNSEDGILLNIKNTSLFFEDFETWPPVGWAIFDNDSNATPQNWEQNLPSGYTSYVATIPYLQNDTINEWLISPAINIPSTQLNHSIKLSFDWNTSYYWAVDPYNYFDLAVKVSTDNGLSWQILWTEDDTNSVVSSGVGWPYDNNWSWHHSSINLDSFANQTIRIAFYYSSQNGGATFLLDNIAVIDFDYTYYDLSVSGNNFVDARIPLSQAEFSFSGNAKNEGAAITDSIYAITQVIGTTYIDSVLLQNPFPIEASEDFTIPNPFIPDYPDNYCATIQLPFANDSININNTDSIFFSVSDSVYAKDFDTFYGSIGFNNQTGIIGSIFKLIHSDTMTSVSLFWHPSFDNTPGDLFSISLYQWDETLETLSNEVFTSEIYTKTAAMMDSSWVCYNTNDIILDSGYYMLGINCLETNNIFIAVDTTKITNSKLFIRFENGIESLSSDFGNILLRMNLGHSNLLSEIKTNTNTDMKIFPNPSKGIFFITNTPQNHGKVQVYDLRGKLLLNRDYKTNVIDISYLDEGSYFIKISMENNIYVRMVNIVK